MFSYTNLLMTLENSWKFIQVNNPEVPDVILLVGSGGRRAKNLYGHFAANSWDDNGKEVHEVLVVAEQLNREPEAIFTTLLHEAVHGVNHARDIKDVSGRRHNKKFVETCRTMLLDPPAESDRAIGWSAATLSEAGKDLYAKEISIIAEELKLVRKLKLAPKANKTLWKSVCGCNRTIRVGKKIYDGSETHINILCTDCNSEFIVEDDE